MQQQEVVVVGSGGQANPDANACLDGSFSRAICFFEAQIKQISQTNRPEIRSVHRRVDFERRKWYSFLCVHWPVDTFKLHLVQLTTVLLPCPSATTGATLGIGPRMSVGDQQNF